MLYMGCLAMGKTFRSPFLPTWEVGENLITHLPTPPLKILLPPVNCTEHWCTSTLNGRVYPSSWLKPDRCYPHLLKQTTWPTSKNPCPLHAFCEKLGKTIFIPVCFLSHHLLWKEVRLLVLMHYSRKAMFGELFLWAVQPFIHHYQHQELLEQPLWMKNLPV